MKAITIHQKKMNHLLKMVSEAYAGALKTRKKIMIITDCEVPQKVKIMFSSLDLIP